MSESLDNNLTNQVIKNSTVYRRSDSIAKLSLALSKAQGEMEAALKSSVNPHFSSKFADLAECWSASRPALSRNELAVIQIPHTVDGKLWLETTLSHSSGEYITGSMMLLHDRPTMQSLGSSITYARRYMLAAMVGITQDDDDGNAASASNQPGFDPKNKSHVDFLIKVLNEKKVTGIWRSNVVSAMNGRKMSELPDIIEKSNPDKPD